MKLTETPNLEALQKVIDLPFLNQVDVPMFQEYLRLVTESNGKLEVPYAQKYYNGKPYGRYYPQNLGKPCTYQWAAVRTALYSDNESDIDIVNCHPQILHQICKQNKIKAPQLAAYIDDRDSYLDRIQVTDDDVELYNQTNHSNWTLKDMKKFVIISSIYGAGLPAIKKHLCLKKSPFTRNSDAFRAEIKRISNEIVKLDKYQTLVRDITEEKKKQKSKYHAGTFLSFILQEEERAYVDLAIKMFHEKDIEVTAYIYDGFQVRCTDTDRINSILKDLNALLPVEFIVKPWKESVFDLDFDLDQYPAHPILPSLLDVPQTDSLDPIAFSKIKKMTDTGTSSWEELQCKKQYFEQHAAYVSSTGNCAVKLDGCWRIMTISHVEKQLTNLRYTDSHGTARFTAWWLTQPDRRMVTSIQWLPYTLHPSRTDSNTLNIFTGLKHKVDLCAPIDMAQVKPWIYHIHEVWADGDAKLGAYMLNWFAHIVQNPAKKTGVNLVLKSVRQGAGKNILTDFFSDNVLGRDHCRQFSDLESLLNKFNASSEKSLFTVLDEIGQGGGSYKNSNRLKDITTRSMAPVERKGMEMYMAPDYNNYAFTSQEDWIVKVELADRRFCCAELSSKHIGDTDYFNELVSLQNDCAGYHFFQYLLRVNLADFKVTDIPMTDWKRHLIEMNFDPMFETLLHCRDKDKVHTVDLMDFYNSIQKSPKTMIKSTQSFNSTWCKYTRWEKCNNLHIETRRKVGFKIDNDMVLNTCRSIRKDPDYQLPLQSDDAPPLDEPLV